MLSEISAEAEIELPVELRDLGLVGDPIPHGHSCPELVRGRLPLVTGRDGRDRILAPVPDRSRSAAVRLALFLDIRGCSFCLFLVSDNGMPIAHVS
jgi:hypothetical protein